MSPLSCDSQGLISWEYVLSWESSNLGLHKKEDSGKYSSQLLKFRCNFRQECQIPDGLQMVQHKAQSKYASPSKIILLVRYYYLFFLRYYYLKRYYFKIFLPYYCLYVPFKSEEESKKNKEWETHHILTLVWTLIMNNSIETVLKSWEEKASLTSFNPALHTYWIRVLFLFMEHLTKFHSESLYKPSFYRMFSASFKIINQTVVKWSILMNEFISSPFWHSTEIILLGFLRHKPPKLKEL